MQQKNTEKVQRAIVCSDTTTIMSILSQIGSKNVSPMSQIGSKSVTKRITLENTNVLCVWEDQSVHDPNEHPIYHKWDSSNDVMDDVLYFQNFCHEVFCLSHPCVSGNNFSYVV